MKQTIKVYAKTWGGIQLDVAQLRKQFNISNSWDLVDDATTPDLVLIGCGGFTHQDFASAVYRQKIKWGLNSFILVKDGEPNTLNIPKADYSISFRPNSDKNYYFNLLIPLTDINLLLAGELPAMMQKNRQQTKKSFCNFIYKNISTFFNLTTPRRDFCKLLSNYKPVDCAGPSLNNTNRLKELERKYSDRYAAKLEFMKDYKFTIAFENSVLPGYFTEKIWHAYMAGTIPIYYGAPEIAEYFNSQSFINCADYKNFDEVIEVVKEIDNNPKLFEQYINAPPLVEGSKFYDFTYDKVSSQMDEIMQRVIEKKHRWRLLKHLKLHKLRFIYWPIFWLGFLLRYRGYIRYIKRYTRLHYPKIWALLGSR